ncbi:Nucleoid occlusion protein [Pseudomonas fluorescens]|uniref:ParB/RepB/Spo0J family partition protein n=1 Tax=Pseudomonas fluorescens TaxID=294 RepID=UPI0012402743|nr:ParB/RepB/Spo0J family partition protein [Pseudomonas fluorescens]VVN27078.1 Nucleoid occlusion protein [Pseudomonas fluorescens]
MTGVAIKQSTSAFGDMGDMMGLGDMSSVLSVVGDKIRPTFAMLKITNIKIYSQQRPEDEMEDEDHTLDDMGDNLDELGMLQPIVVCEDESDDPEDWRLIAGERRTRSATRKGWVEVPAMCFGKLTEEQISDIQFAENVHRLNLKQMTEAKQLKKRLDEQFGGNVRAMCEAKKLNASWVSKRLALLTLPEQAQRLVKENLSADLEVLNSVKTIEKIDPVAAKEVVDQLKDAKATGQKGTNARKIVQQKKQEVKPSRKPATNPANVATPRNESHKDNGPVNTLPASTLAGDPTLQALQKQMEQQVETPSDALLNEAEQKTVEGKSAPVDTSKVPALPPMQALAKAYTALTEHKSDAKTVLSAMPDDERSGVQDWLNSFYDAGVDCKNIALAVVQGLRNGSFATEGHGAFAMAAFLSGCEEGVMFNPVNILGIVKA